MLYSSSARCSGGTPLPRRQVRGCSTTRMLNVEGFQRVDALIDAEIDALLDTLAQDALPRATADLPVYDVLRYHLGMLDADFNRSRSHPGKRVRSKLCLACCEAAGGDPEQALPVAAAIELLHNFTLIHDDIQDGSVERRGRRTVWSIWGTAQAINAGDAMFAVAHLALDRLRLRGVVDHQILALARELHRTTLKIVEGQVLDLGFERRDDVEPTEYLTMIEGKTAAIMGYAAWSGAWLAGASAEQAAAFRGFGLALGLGFQIQDDLLGIWGAPDVTGKSAADDIRRRKQSLPLLLLGTRVDEPDRRLLRALYAEGELSSDEINVVLELLERYEIRPLVEAEVERWHGLARERVQQLGDDIGTPAALEGFVAVLARRNA